MANSSLEDLLTHYGVADPSMVQYQGGDQNAYNTYANEYQNRVTNTPMYGPNLYSDRLGFGSNAGNVYNFGSPTTDQTQSVGGGYMPDIYGSNDPYWWYFSGGQSTTPTTIETQTPATTDPSGFKTYAFTDPTTAFTPINPQETSAFIKYDPTALTTGGVLGSALSNVAQGFSPYVSKAYSYLNSLAGNGDYAGNMADIAKQNEKFATQYPMTAAGTNLAGALGAIATDTMGGIGAITLPSDLKRAYEYSKNLYNAAQGNVPASEYSSITYPLNDQVSNLVTQSAYAPYDFTKINTQPQAGTNANKEMTYGSGNLTAKEIQDFLSNNASNPEAVYNMAQSNNLSNQQIANLTGTPVTAIDNYFKKYQSDKAAADAAAKQQASALQTIKDQAAQAQQAAQSDYQAKIDNLNQQLSSQQISQSQAAQLATQAQTDLQKQLDNLNTQLSSQNSSIGGYQTQITDLNSQLSKLQSAAQAQQAAQSDYQAKIDNLNQQLSSQQISQSQAAQLATQAQADLQKQLDNLNAQLSGQNSSISGYQTQIADLNSQLAKLQSAAQAQPTTPVTQPTTPTPTDTGALNQIAQQVSTPISTPTTPAPVPVQDTMVRPAPAPVDTTPTPAPITQPDTPIPAPSNTGALNKIADQVNQPAPAPVTQPSTPTAPAPVDTTPTTSNTSSGGVSGNYADIMGINLPVVPYGFSGDTGVVTVNNTPSTPTTQPKANVAVPVQWNPDGSIEMDNGTTVLADGTVVPTTSGGYGVQTNTNNGSAIAPAPAQQAATVDPLAAAAIQEFNNKGLYPPPGVNWTLSDYLNAAQYDVNYNKSKTPTPAPTPVDSSNNTGGYGVQIITNTGSYFAPPSDTTGIGTSTYYNPPTSTPTGDVIIEDTIPVSDYSYSDPSSYPTWQDWAESSGWNDWWAAAHDPTTGWLAKGGSVDFNEIAKKYNIDGDR